mgnify:CR=1 FL=1
MVERHPPEVNTPWLRQEYFFFSVYTLKFRKTTRLILKRIKYLTTMYILIMFICFLNLLQKNNVFYIILSLADIVSLYSLNIKKEKKLK